MKRSAAEESPQSRKNARKETDPFLPEHQTTASAVYTNGSDARGFLSGKVFMVWPVNQKMRFKFETVDYTGKALYIEIELSGLCRDYFEILKVHPQDQVQIALKGAQVLKLNSSSASKSFPMALKYPDGVIMKFIFRKWKRDEDGHVVDVWKLRQAAQLAKEDWYMTPPIPNDGPCIAQHESIIKDRLPKSIAHSAGSIQPHTLNSGIHELKTDVFPDESTSRPSHQPVDRGSNLQHNVPRKPLSSVRGVGRADPSSTCMGSSSRTSQESIPRESHLDNSNANPAGKGHVTSPQDAPFSKKQQKRRKKEQRKAMQEQIISESVSTSKPNSLRNAVGARQVDAGAVGTGELAEPRSIRSPPAGQREEPTPRPGSSTAGATRDQTQAFDENTLNGVREAKGKAVDSRPATARVVETSASDFAAQPTAQSSDANKGNSGAESTSDPISILKRGFETENREVYTPIDKLESGSKVYLVVGIVTSSSQTKKTSTNEWSRTLTIVDPSIFDSLGASSVEFKITCFTSKYEGWLPAPNVDDVLMLRGLKCSMWHGRVSGLGYKDKLKWAAFSPKARKVHYGELHGHPESEGIDDGYGYNFSPFFKPGHHELARCVKLADWWSVVQQTRVQEMGYVHQVGGAQGFGTRAAREHRLICEASPDLPPNGFFDCTVEVLYGHDNDNGVYSVYVTDYSNPNPSITPVQASWCAPELADRVLKIEMWPPAYEAARTMQRGDYYFIQNNRMKISRGGYVEATFSEVAKLRKLGDMDVDNYPHLQALLQRKKDWEASGGAATNQTKFKHRTLSEVQENVYFDCTVEILRVILTENETPHMYITDYTFNVDIPPAPPSAKLPRNLDGYAVQVTLADTQVELAKNFEAGVFCSIRSLRLKKSLSGQGYRGHLGGDQRLIHRMRSQDTSDVNLKELFQRKTDFEEVQNRVNSKNWSSPVEGGLSPQSVSKRKSEPPSIELPDCMSIKDIKASMESLSNINFVGRAVLLYPLLEDCVVLQCTKCLKDIKKFKACVDCDGMERAHVKYLYRLWVFIQDEDGAKIPISLSGDNCPLFEGLPPVDLRENRAALERFAARLAPIIGSLAEVESGYQVQEAYLHNSPVLKFTVDTWDSAGVTLCTLIKYAAT